MKVVIIVCLSLSLLASLAGLFLLRSDGTEQRYFQAQREIQRAMSKSEDEELKRAISTAQVIEKTLYVNRGLGRGLVWISAGSSVLALAFIILKLKNKEPIRPSQTTTGSFAPDRV